MKIIAEFCQNHLGKLENLEKMVVQAKESGASHAKIQGLYSNEITKREEFEDPNGKLYRPFDKEVARLQSLDLSFETEKWFVKFCLENQIIPMITVFTHKGVERAKLAGFKHIKIASYDCASIPIIRKSLEFADELVISTGATYWAEIQKTAEFIHKFKKQYQEITKPSDSGLTATKIAIILGATYIERHFTILDRSETRDGPVSINPAELKELRNFFELPKMDQLKGINFKDLQVTTLCDSLEPVQEEIINRSYYRGRVASTYSGKYVFSWEEVPFEK
jgi:sialic acid synthase SpsE